MPRTRMSRVLPALTTHASNRLHSWEVGDLGYAGEQMNCVANRLQSIVGARNGWRRWLLRGCAREAHRLACLRDQDEFDSGAPFWQLHVVV